MLKYVFEKKKMRVNRMWNKFCFLIRHRSWLSHTPLAGFFGEGGVEKKWHCGVACFYNILMQVFSFQVYATHLGQYTNNPNAYIIFYEREKPITNENTLSLKIVSTHSISPSSLSNGCSNGSGPPRTNGFFKNSFSTGMNHYSR